MSSGGTDEAVPVLRQPASQPAARVLTRAYTPTGLWGREGKGRKHERAVRFVAAAAAAAAVLLNWQPPERDYVSGKAGPSVGPSGI
ncbi:unnamed protein product [Sphagnum troendelagicum]|uniref:Uncharacterized protein n=1 Tax=Sphagnum troendelagicum TaxID=128251 RepID=A0ABP0UP24_9BRYO